MRDDRDGRPPASGPVDGTDFDSDPGTGAGTGIGVGVEPVEGTSADGRLFRFDPAVTPPSMALVGALARTAGCDPLDLEPLYDSVDPDALDALVGRSPAAGTRDGVRGGWAAVTVRVGDRRVTVDATGAIEVRSPDGGRGRSRGVHRG
jgi:hypothetical protein